MNASEVNATYVEITHKEWEFAQAWASRLSDKDLRAAKRLKVPGDAGLAAEQEYSRRFGLFARS